jgi:tRNA (guanine37-N1)-methyltransferase
MAMRLKDALQGVLTDAERQWLVRSFDVVGDIAIITIPEQLRVKKLPIAQAILAGNKKIKVVVEKAGFYGGEFRTIPLRFLAGEDRRETELREFGIRMRLNPESVYFSIRSSNERRRIASLVAPGEDVLVLFSGVAPYPLIISRFSQARTIVGIEKNPKAHGYALENLRLNKRLDNIVLHLGDAETILPSVTRSFDRLVMPLPTKAEKFLPAALRVLKPDGFLHFYDLQNPDSFASSVAKITAAAGDVKRRIESVAIFRCGHCAPRTHRICLDARIR